MTAGTVVITCVAIVCGTLLAMTIIGAIINCKKNASTNAISDAIIKSINTKK